MQRHMFLAAAASALLVCSGAIPALAHAHLVRATPADGATGAPPNEVSLVFSERLEAAFNSVVVKDATGKRVDKGNAQLDKADRKTLRVSLPPLAPGVYKVEWRAVSADSHKIEGNFTFRVDE